MMADDLRARLHEQRPFEPFTIRIADGRRFHIPTAAYAHVLPKGMRIVIWTNDFEQHVLPMTQISGVEAGPTESPETAD